MIKLISRSLGATRNVPESTDIIHAFVSDKTMTIDKAFYKRDFQKSVIMIKTIIRNRDRKV